jgi:peptidyl-tRNA hydrolase, PTH1 family
MERRLFVGLGNPDAEYASNRHNIGFRAVNEIARRHGSALWRRGFQSTIAEIRLDGETVVLLKPQTYMNESGRAVQEAMSFYKLELPSLTVFHDEIELPPAKVRVKIGGSDAGHNGLRSVSSHVGKDYKRVRIGVGHPRDWLGAGHPSLKDVVHRHVLSDFTKDDRPWVEALLEAVADNAGLLAKDRDSTFQNKVHLAMQAKGFFDKDDGGEKQD